MDEIEKKEILQEALTHVYKICTDISVYAKELNIFVKRLREKLQKEDLDDPEMVVATIIDKLESEQQMQYASKIPYFIKCDVIFDDEQKQRSLYFGRFQFRDDEVYSWIAPAASIRFESPGRFSYTLPNGTERTGTLVRKNQYMIIDREIFFLSSEAIDYARELIYQKHFTEQKTGFMLPEIVEQMEKAQDTIIRSHYFGSFLVSGVAGSGKTTLALHRVAYLVQSPETEKLFNPSTITVFVQDASTKKYFSALLPELGINRVNITTFDEWAMKILEIDTKTFVRRYGNTEAEKDAYEFSKNKALQSLNIIPSGYQLETILNSVYGNFMTYKEKELLQQQLQENLLDSFDLTVLLKIRLLLEKALIQNVEKFKKQKSTGKYIKSVIKQPINYSLIVIDEAENYLNEQIKLIKTCINSQTNAVIYVGDLVQRTMLWTLKDWSEVHEEFKEDRKVVLKKVYRNTKQILEYIQNNGYKTEIPQNIKNGEMVVEKIFSHKSDEVAFVEKLVKENKNKTTGILAKTEEYLEVYKKRLGSSENRLIMTINEAQGVEFDTVILVGINREFFKNYDLDETIDKERKKVNRDLIYVALTRAINRLYVCGDTKLQMILSHEILDSKLGK